MSGVGVNVLLRQLHGLEGFRVISENAPAGHLALAKRICVAEIPDGLDSAARARRMDLRTEDDGLPGIAQVAVDPAVVLPSLDPATKELKEAVKTAEYA